MMPRQMVGLRKGAAPADASPPADDAPTDPNVVECPNCKCQFNPDTMEVVKDGNGAKSGDYQGADILGNELPTPLNPDAAAKGEQAITNMLSGTRGRL